MTQEKIPEEQWCYIPNEAGKYEKGMKMAPKYLQRTGYRLPTEAEWEYACRAGTETNYSFGEAEEVLGKYAWYAANSSVKLHAVGGKKPNDLGLFDMHGNLYQWTLDVYGQYFKREAGKARGDPEDIEDILDGQSRVLRGGVFGKQASNMRSTNRFNNVPFLASPSNGFRPARTFTP